jgi:topoisomerase-4 subunit A
VPGPDYPGGGQIISSAGDIADAYRTGRGSLKVRARWKIEDLARGQWQLVVTELPPNVSTQRVLEEIEELTNPKVKAGKKACRRTRPSSRPACWRCWTWCATSPARTPPCAWCSSPRPAASEQQELITTLLAHTSLETSAPINLTMVGLDGRPTQKSLRQMLTEWIAFRQQTIERRSQHRLAKVLDRIHILEGRQLVLLNIDEVIAIIRQSTSPRQALMARFSCPSARPKTFSKSACASWRGWKRSRSSRSSRACAKSRPSSKKSWAARPPCAA